MYTGRKPEQVYLVVKMKKNRMERNLKRMKKGIAVSQKLC